MSQTRKVSNYWYQIQHLLHDRLLFLFLLGGPDEEGKKSKKKKKAKKPAEKVEKEEKKGKPGKAQLSAMREALAKVKEEEDKRQKEAEAEEKRRREAEERLLAQLQKEKERKEKKKLREKERIKRQKEEGRFLTAEQKLKAERSRQLIAHLQQQGGLVPPAAEIKTKRPVYSDKRKKKSAPSAGTEGSNLPGEPEENQSEATKENVPLEEDESEGDEGGEEEVVDSWDAIAPADSADGGVKQPVAPDIDAEESDSEESGDSEEEGEATTSSDEETSAAPPNETKEQMRERISQRLKVSL